LAGTFPTGATASDGTTITINRSDPFGVADPAFFGLVFNGTLNGLDNPILMAMADATNGDFAITEFIFSRPVQLCFALADVDAAAGGWEDTIEIRGSNAGVPVTLGAADVVTGAANTFLGPDTVRGVSATNTATGNVQVNFPAEIDRVEIEHRDNSADVGFQFIGIHDFSWC